MKRKLPLLGSVFGRVTMSALLASLISTLVLFLVVQQIVRSESERALEQQIDTDLAGLADIYISGGGSELVARVRDRLALNGAEGEQSWYLIANAAGQPIAGNIAQWPALSSEVSQGGYISLPDGPRIYARATQLGPGVRLVVGRSFAARQALLRRLAAAFSAAGVVVALFSLAVGHFAARRLRRRIEAVNAAYDAIRAGDIAARAPDATLPGSFGDELAELSANTNAMLDQVGRLIDAQRAVSDQTAHEIRTPLMHLDTRILKAMEQTDDPEIARTLGQSREEIRGVVRLLDSLLDIAGTEALKGDLRGLPEVDLSEIGDTLADLYGGSAEELGLGFRAHIAPDVRVRADSMQMMRLMSNLLDNAFKYVPMGGAVSLSIAPGPCITVADNGKGIAPEDRALIFERYTRLPAGQAVGQDAGGHGLGLALAKAIAERHGLAIRVTDAGPGARFIIEPEVGRAA